MKMNAQPIYCPMDDKGGFDPKELWELFFRFACRFHKTPDQRKNWIANNMGALRDVGAGTAKRAKGRFWITHIVGPEGQHIVLHSSALAPEQIEHLIA
jgi:hypothetical protein